MQTKCAQKPLIEKRDRMSSRPGKGLLRFLAFALVLSLFLYGLNRTLTPQFQYGNVVAPMTSTYNGFYEMERDSIDVLLLGTSHIGTALNPQDIYDAAGIRSYNLASNSQTLWMTYYWLVEALQYQSPKVVVFDCLNMFSGMYWNDSTARWAFDEMRDGPVKAEAVALLSNWEDENVATSYHIPLIRYHSRWTEMEAVDFLWLEEDVGKLAKGFYRAWGVESDNGYSPLDSSAIEDAEPAATNAASMEYMDRIVALCEEENIELILIKTPALSQTAERSRAIQDYADENGLLFYDFNDSRLYEEIGYDSATDMYDDNSHSNPSGARKISVYLANELIGLNGLEAVVDDQWEDSREFNEHCWENASLCAQSDFLSYLEALNQERYSVLISARVEDASSLSDEIVMALKALAPGSDLPREGAFNYALVLDRNELSEYISEDNINLTGALQSGTVPYFMSAGEDVNTVRSEDWQYAPEIRGFTIVVYDNELKDVVDGVCFQYADGIWTAVR